MSDRNLLGCMSEISKQLQASMDRSLLGWEQSEFRWIRQQPSRRVGAIGEGFARQLLIGRGFDVQKALSSEHDMLVDGVRLEVKFSTLWESGQYKFQQIRNQSYDAMLLLGLSPSAAHMWVVPKSVVLHARSNGLLLGQHGGKSASETAWLPIAPSSPPSWLAEHGPDMDQAMAQLRAIKNTVSTKVG